MSDLRLVAFEPSQNKKERKRFIELQWTLNRNDPAWVPPLRISVEDNLDSKKNPFYKHAKIQCWNAYRGSEHVGRIAAIVDDRHNEFHGEKTGFWGFFECVNDQKVCAELFKAAEQWLKGKGMQTARGPANPSLNHECGMVINSFEREPYFMMTHNPPYYVDLVEKQGYGKVKDLLAFDMNPGDFDHRAFKVAEKVKEKANVTIRGIDMKNFNRDVQFIRDVYNTAWEKNWGFVPTDEDEFKHLAKQLKDVIWPEFCQIAFAGDKPVGFALSLPDLNQVLKEIPSGKLLPFGIFKLLRGMKPKAKKINRVRVITLGVVPEFRRTGLSAVFYVEAYQKALELGLHGQSEMSWILEDNKEMIGAIESFAKRKAYKTYRLYDKTL